MNNRRYALPCVVQPFMSFSSFLSLCDRVTPVNNLFILLAVTALAPNLPAAPFSNAEAICGTWVLQQASNSEELKRFESKGLETALNTPNIRGFCLRVPWKAIDHDLGLAEQGLQLARRHHVAFSIRFMAGRHTPARVFDSGCRYYLTSRSKEKAPMPFLEDGSPNAAFEQAYEALVARLASWCRTNQVRLLHLAWYGQDWAELNHGLDVRQAKGYSQANWVRAHERLIAIGLKYAGDNLAVEFPLSGHGPLTEVSLEMARHTLEKLGPLSQKLFFQANGWGPKGDWGAPTTETEKAFDRIWALPLCRGQQAIQPQDYDWTVMFQKLYENQATYCEIYAPSFTLARHDLLAGEIRKFADHCAKNGPLLPKAP